MTESPEVVTAGADKPNSFQACASFCLWSPVVAVVLNLFVLPKTPVTTPSEATVHLVLVSLVPVLGILAGLGSIFGIARYGRKGILWKAVAGLVIWAVLAAAAVPAFLMVKEKARQAHERHAGRPPR